MYPELKLCFQALEEAEAATRTVYRLPVKLLILQAASRTLRDQGVVAYPVARRVHRLDSKTGQQSLQTVCVLDTPEGVVDLPDLVGWDEILNHHFGRDWQGTQHSIKAKTLSQVWSMPKEQAEFHAFSDTHPQHACPRVNAVLAQMQAQRLNTDTELSQGHARRRM